MSSESFNKASSKLLGKFAAGVNIATPASGERRLTKAEREKIIAAESEGKEPASAAAEVEEIPAEKRPVGRPKSEKTFVDPVVFPGRMERSYRRAIKVWAAERGLTLQEVFDEAMALFAEKNGIEF